MDIDDQKIGSENKKNDQTMNNYSKRVCQFCLKEFSSGKALGGHMRIHVQRAPNKKKDDNDNNVQINKNPNCVICDKDFPSWKSLYGHMRCHPGRGWKGINPPSFSSSSTYSLSDVDDDDDVRNTERLLASGEKNRAAAVDLTASLKRWPVTAERGRKATTPAAAASSEVSSSSVDFELLDTVNYLLMLSRGASPESKNRFPETNLNENTEQKTYSNRAVIDLVHGESVEKTEHDQLINMNMNKMKRKKEKVKLSDLESSKNASPSLITQVLVDKYKCDICDKSFSSHQAFGGHRSSHNKLKIIIHINSNEDLSAQSKAPSSEARPICRRGFEFDLNEVPPISGFESRLDNY